MSYENMKSNSSNAISKLLAAAEKAGGGTEKKSYADEREWKPTVDKAGNGYAVLRFLPAAEGQDTPWVRYWDHGFKGPTGRWYIENSLTTIGKDDPVSEMNSQLWNSGRDEDKETARSRKRRLHYVSNVYVVSDPSNPENEGIAPSNQLAAVPQSNSSLQAIANYLKYDLILLKIIHMIS